MAEILRRPRYDSLPDRVRDHLSRERDHVVGLHPADPEAIAAQARVEVVEGIPWQRAEEPLDAPTLLRRTLDLEHVGREREKDQALDYLMARHTGETTVLCLAGPDGIGKTAFARALAAAVGRRFVRVSLAGVENPAAIRGVARPASDAAPGRVVDALRRLGPLPGRAGDNPLVLLGELDRVGEAAADALLGAIDPVRSGAFRDRYVGLPLDLAGVLFVAAAIDPGRVPPLLTERLEVLPLAGYTDDEKQAIAVRHLIPQRLERNGLSVDDLSFAPAALRILIGGYWREPGVCGLDNRIDTVCRRVARLWAEGISPHREMGPETVTAWLGAPRFRDEEIASRTGRAGVALGLAATREGGDVLVVEATCFPGRGQLRVTGTVGPIVTESVNVALTWVRSNADRLADLDAGLDDAADLHVHVGEAARSKDGAVSTCCTIQINGRNAADHRRLPRRGPRSTPRSDGQGWSTAAKADTVWLRLSRAASAGGKTRPVHRAWRLRGRQSRARLRSTHRTGKNQRAKPMGEIHADVTLENAVDRGYFRRGDRAEADIRRATVDGIVDTGAVTLVLPQNVVERLGLEPQGTAFVTYADERREERPSQALWGCRSATAR